LAGVTTITNTAAISGTNDPGSSSNDETTPVTAAPDLVITKTDKGITVEPGDLITYTLTYTNVGNQDATGVTITETVPSYTSFITTTGWTCVGGTCTYPLGDLAVNITGTITFVVQVDPSLPAGVTSITNTVVITDDGSNGADPTPLNNEDDETTPVTAAPDLVITKTDDDITVEPGDLITYTLTLTNTGNQQAANVVITETVPANTSFVAAGSSATWSCPNGSQANNTCTFTIGNLNAGATLTRTFVVRVASTLPAGVTTITNTARIGSSNHTGSDSNTEITPVEAAPDLAITKTDNGITVQPGGLITYTLHYTNTGNQDATGVVITETVPADTSFVSADSSAGWSCADGPQAGNTCVYTRATTLNAGASDTLTFVVQINNPLPVGVEQVVNTAQIADDGTNGTTPTPTTTVTTTVTFPPISLGNRVFYDTNNDGIDNDGDGVTLGSSTGVANVTVQLLLDADRDGQLTGDEQTWIAETTTDADGFYLFTEQTHRNGAMLTNTLLLYPGQYVIGLPASQFATGAALEGYHSSGTTIDATGALTETIIGPGDRQDRGTHQRTGFYDAGVLSAPVEVVTGQAPRNEPEDPGSSPNEAPILDQNSDLTIDFGFYTASLGDQVWLDDGRGVGGFLADGLRNGEETGLSGLAIALLPASGETILFTTTTGVSGTYTFTGLSQGDYRVRITMPEGYVSTRDTAGTLDPNNNLNDDDNGVGSAPGTATSNAFTLTSGGISNTLVLSTTGSTHNATLDFGIVRAYSLGNQVWNDRNNNGLFDNGEDGLEGVTLRLFLADGTTRATHISGAQVDDQTTDATGNYTFTDLAAGSYVVRVLNSNFSGAGVLAATASLPAFSSSTGNNGSATGPYEGAATPDPDDGVDNDDNGTTDANGHVNTLPVTISTTNNLTLDFGFYRPASLGDRVWLDRNADGIQDPSELGLSNVTVELSQAGDPGSFLISTTTDISGTYLFTNLGAGDYVLTFVRPEGYYFSQPGQGEDTARNSDADQNSGETVIVTLAEGQTDLTWDAGLYRGASIGNLVWDDTNGNGVQQSGENGIADVLVTLTGVDSLGATVSLTTTTDASGLYTFTNLVPGTYTVTVTPPAGYLVTARNQGEPDADSDAASDGAMVSTILTSGEADLTWDAGLFRPATLGDRVWQDTNSDGLQTLGEAGFAGVTVDLVGVTGAGVPVTATTTTDATGFYTFTTLAPGVYTVTVTAPDGYVFSQPNVGSDPTRESDADATGVM
ncbi:SdrD B-like domain-containing protein, partial [Candidatus Chloroploca sp. Khr17]|uniref:SdrD B-like domain-containing protein n=1 Tax=Candidatus Chloroploca sp. Khr17 TaxID=2496869 RepID=UPI00101BB057